MQLHSAAALVGALLIAAAVFFVLISAYRVGETQSVTPPYTGTDSDFYNAP